MIEKTATTEYLFLMIRERADAILNAQAVEGWECFAVTSGGYDCRGQYFPDCKTYHLRRPRPDIPADPPKPAFVAPKGRPGRKPGRPRKNPEPENSEPAKLAAEPLGC